ncbi:Lpp/OprI family alanine-zipper lipoprotein [Vibrio sp. 10N.222.54.A1]|jgi:murein lipoprotein|uniref:Major outer membrane lipoprotein Lpp n=3 Tax=Vibrio TaxID=662 RepID=A0A7Z1MJD7_9VIBR|nr:MULTISPECIES: Lpp/OprI family alanine-zipper lipoprotein [Vibrio]MCF7497067.1 Lpp/OprI family alanine-zipper lipoprotein [Vibrio sp. L5-1]MCW8345505.1 Lpp/OprI family alanine-zipper lipoprotein [Vibrio qingdaonensis]PMK78425.1 hypothetical protein BCT92_20505 [Vibrio sp. 10N.261.52.E5]PMP25104.1 hypothetical protein BCS91_12680 [Vibrio cyclitrophicus]PMP29945.1 hypothetical protein BCS90_00595 [Vibrio cyclitrophicus]
MNKMLVSAVTSSALLLGGCSSSPDEETMTKINNLNNQVSLLNQDLQDLKEQKVTLTSEAQLTKSTAVEAQEEADRANERIDNITQSCNK